MEQGCNITDISFHFNHIIKSQVRENSESCFPDKDIRIMEILVEEPAVRLDNVRKSMQEVSNGDNDVIFYY